jgi:nicotinate dehydrogenase subunit B
MTQPANRAPFGQATTELDRWIAIETNGAVTAFSGKVELGTGVRTALAQIVAEELDVPLERVHMVMGDTALTPDEGITAGSMTIRVSGSALRRAAAEARRTMLNMASDELDAGVEELAVHEGVISVKSDAERATTYAALMGGKKFEREVTGTAPVKNPADYKVVGMPAARVDIPPKVRGEVSFVQDLRLPGMVHARVVRPPSPAAKLISIDKSSVQDVPGIIQIVQQGNFIGVVAEREEQAIAAAKQLKAEWQEEASLPGNAKLYAALQAQPTQDETLAEVGEVDKGLANGQRMIEATYYQPFHAHAAIGPACAVAESKDGQITIWSNTQGPNPIRGAIAQFLEVAPETIRLIHMEGAGAYGQNGTDDVAAEAAFLSKAVGRPVRVQWSRTDEFAWEPKSAPMVMKLKGTLDGQRKVAAWDYEFWSPTHTNRPRTAGQLLAAQWVAGQAPQPALFFFGAQNCSVPTYNFGAKRVVMHKLAQALLRISSFRSLGGAGNSFAKESFMDELATAAQVDAVEFRLRHLTDPRAVAVLKAAAEKAGWAVHPASLEKRTGVVTGRGVAYAPYGEDAYVATIVEVEVDTASGGVKVKRIVIAHDCGLIINPDGLRNQIEGNVLQSLSRALKEEVKFDERGVTSLDWESYPILKFSEVPEVEIVLVNRPDLPATGAGEPATVGTAPALANAIFDACGARVRQVPFTPERVKAALG